MMADDYDVSKDPSLPRKPCGNGSLDNVARSRMAPTRESRSTTALGAGRLSPVTSMMAICRSIIITWRAESGRQPLARTGFSRILRAGQRAANIMSLIQSAKLKTDTLRIATSRRYESACRPTTRESTRRTASPSVGAARRDTEAMKGSRNLAACVLVVLTACINPRNGLCTEASTVLVTLDQEAGENGLCHVHYKDVDRTAPCTEIVVLMRSELRIPAHTHVTLQASKTTL
jgi:hypothetical protein